MRLTAKYIAILFVLTATLCLHATPALTAAGTYPELFSEAAVLMDASTGQVLFAKNMHEKQFPASITKIMTGMMALEKGKLTDTLTMSRNAVFSVGRNTSHIALDAGEELSLEQALYALSIDSANDAANGIAEHIGGSLESFARLMDEKAVEIGAQNTRFINAHGLPDSNHYTTAYDMAVIMLHAVKNPKFLEVFSETRYAMTPTNKQPETRYFNSSNPLLNGGIPLAGIMASKSGWTSQARHTLVTAARQGNRELIAVVLNCPDSDAKYEDTIKLLNYGFEDFFAVTFHPDDLEVTIADVIVKPAEKTTRLLHKSLSAAAIKTSHTLLAGTGNELPKVKISFDLKQANEFMHSSLGDVYITLEAEAAADNYKGIKVYLRYIGIAIFFCGGFFVFLLSIRKRRARRKRQQHLKYRYYQGNRFH